MHFDRRMLPILGVCWERFDTQQEATAFARWAECETRREAHPCEAFVSLDEGRWEVKVRNW
jgi:hypothetical protein